MSDLSFFEKNRLEKLFGMGSGYVLNFSNRTFHEFVAASVGRDIYDDKYDYASGSKANRLRGFWDVEPNLVTGKLVRDLIAYAREEGLVESDQLCEACSRIADRLCQGAPVVDVSALIDQAQGRSVELLARSVEQAINENKPEAGLDRLHTFVVKYLRGLCEKHGIQTPWDKPLHSLAGEFVKHLSQEGCIESEMTERILKSSISTMEAFNRGRNQQSLAHDNPVLNYEESLLIFNHVMSSLRFIEALENPQASDLEYGSIASADDIPF